MANFKKTEDGKLEITSVETVELEILEQQKANLEVELAATIQSRENMFGQRILNLETAIQNLNQLISQANQLGIVKKPVAQAPEAQEAIGGTV